MPTSQMVRANSVARALNVVGDRWSLLILSEAFMGTRRFTDWRDRIGIASNVLTDRLKRLVAAGCLTPVTRDGGARSSEYRLTQMGRDLYPTALMVWRFARNWSANRAHTSTLTHLDCGQEMVPQLVCRTCGKEVRAHEVRYEDGPGAGLTRKAPPRHSRRASAPTEGGGSQTLFGEAVDLIGDRWTQLVLASFFMGIRRHDDIVREWKIATNILADRLKRLLESGVVQRRLYQQGPDRFEYVLTPKGLDLYPLVASLLTWGDRWLAEKAGPPLLLYHKPCGNRLEMAVVCDRCGGDLDPHNVKYEVRLLGEARRRAAAKTESSTIVTARPAARTS